MRAQAARIEALRAQREAAVITMNRREAEFVAAHVRLADAKRQLDVLTAELAAEDHPERGGGR